MSPANVKNLILQGCIFIISFLYLYQFIHVYSGEGVFTDEMYYLSLSQRISHGDVMYRDFFAFYMPFPFYFIGLIFSLSGPSVVIARLCVVAFISLSSLLSFIICFNKLKCGWVSLIAPLTIVSLIYPFWGIFSPRYFTLLLYLSVIYLMIQHIYRYPFKYNLFFSGALCGLNVFSIQTDGIVFLLITSMFLFAYDSYSGKSKGNRIAANILKFSAGSLLIVIPWITYFLIEGGLYQFIYNTSVWLFKGCSSYYSTSYFQQGIVYIVNHAQSIFLSPSNFIIGIINITGLIMIGFMPLVVYSATSLHYVNKYFSKRKFSQKDWVVIYLTAIGIGALLANINRTDPWHMILISFPWVSLVLLFVNNTIADNTEKNYSRGLIQPVCILYISTLIILNVSWMYSLHKYFIYPISVAGDTLYSGNVSIANEMNSLKRFFDTRISPHDTVFGYSWGGSYLFYLGRNNKCHYGELLPSKYTEEQMSEGREFLKNNDVPFVILDKSGEGPQQYSTQSPDDPLRDYIINNYTVLKEYPVIGIKVLGKR